MTKARLTMVADAGLIHTILKTMAETDSDPDSLDLQYITNALTGRKAAIKKLIEAHKTKHAKRKRGRPSLGVPDKILAAVRQLQDSAVARNGGGAPLKEVKKLVKSPSVSPAITDLIKHKKLIRPKPGHYRVA